MPESARAPEASKPAGVTADGRTNLYRQIVELAHEGIWIHDLAGVTTYANAQMADVVGYSVPEMYGLSMFELFDDVGKEQALGMLDRERATPLTEQVDCRFIRKDGSLVWCLLNRSPLLDDDGRHVGSLNLVSDITERKLVDERLRHSGNLLAEAQRVAHLGSWSWEVDSASLNWSDELYRILGVAPTVSDVTYQTYADRVHPDDRRMVNGALRACLDGGPKFTYECRIVRPSGQLVWIHTEGEPVRDATGFLRTIRGTVLDITAYKSAQEEAQRTSSRYRLLQRMATEANRDVGFESVLQLAVQEILLHAKWPVGRAYLVAEDPPRLIPAPPARPHPSRLADTSGRRDNHGQGGTDRDSPSALAARVLATAGPDHVEGGFAFPVLVDGAVVAVLEFLSEGATALDEELLETCEQVGTQLSRVVERQRATDDLATARDAAMESSRVKSEFLATMSHEIRTPMNGVIGLTNLLLDTQLDERQRQYAEGVYVSGEALLTVINDILDFSKLEAGKVELDYEDFDVRRIVEEVAALLAPAAYAKNVEMLAYCLPDVPAVLVGDSGRIRQIVLNLVSNGVKFTETGEVVTKVTASVLAAGEVSVRFEVRDTGIGIAELSRDRLFTSFSQADASTTRRYGGTGLGLAICQRLVAAMGGTIGFDSEVGVGSRFWFEIPLKLASHSSAERPAPLPDLLSDLRVLVVDDNATNRMILESQLGSWQLRPDSVASAPDALAQLRAMAEAGLPYAIVVLDMCMPDMDGLQLAELISADPVLSGTRMIMLTSTSELDSATLLAAGVTEWLLKPVRSSDLYDRLLRLMTPQSRPEPAVRPAAGTQLAGEPRLGRVLVVEDNVLNQLVAQGIVNALGYSVDVVDNGAEALRAILHTAYAAVLMDCHMPVLDGFEATREIRRREGGGAHLPIIAMTAGAMTEDRDLCAAAGMDDFIAKPVTPAGVEDALTRWAGSIKDRSALPQPPPPRAGGPVWDHEPALDLNRITQLRQLGSMGGTNLLGRVVGVFARDGEISLGDIRGAAAARSVTGLQQALHKLRGTSANMGANRVAALCRELEAQTGHERSNTETTLMTSGQLDQLAGEFASASRAIARAVGDDPSLMLHPVDAGGGPTRKRLGE